MKLALHNREGICSYDLPADWYECRSKGISAFLRVRGEERWIGPCIESIIDFFDEIVITIEPTGDRTMDIIRSFGSPKIRVFEYPFKLDATAPADSIHSGIYYSNWTVAHTSCSHVCQWDADMILLPSSTRDKEFILRKNIVRFAGYDVVTPDFKYISISDRSDSKRLRKLADVRIYRVNKHLFTIWNERLYNRGKNHPGKYSFNAIMDRFNYFGNTIDLFDPRLWKQYPHSQWQHFVNLLMRKDYAFPAPIYLHVKYLKDWKGRYVTQADDAAADPSSTKGKPIPVAIPAFVFKTPEDYLHAS